jgi:lysylphosphatidylglycerol synthetase-like protein (DUF2156 family)
MDEIQRKLALIDKQLAWGPAYIHKQIISTSPLLFVVIGLMAGILLQSAFTLSIGFWLILLILCIIAVIFSYLASRKSYLIKEKNLPFITAYLALVCFLCLGAIRLTTFHQPRPNDIPILSAASAGWQQFAESLLPNRMSRNIRIGNSPCSSLQTLPAVFI